MAIAVVAHTVEGSTNSLSFTTATPIDTTGANLLVVAISEYDTGTLTPSDVTDSKSNSWTALSTYTHDSDSNQVTIWYSTPTSVGSGHTFTVTSALSNHYPVITVLALSGAKASSPFDQAAGAESSSTTVQPGSVTPTEANEIVITAFSADGSLTVNDLGVGMSVSDSVNSVGGQHIAGGMAYIIQTSAAAINPTWTTSSSSNSAAIATFKAEVINITVIDSDVGGATSSTGNATTGALTTTGANLLVVAVGAYDAGFSGSVTVSDSKSNSWNPLTVYTVGGASTQVQLFYASPSNSSFVGSSHTFTATTGNDVAYLSIAAIAVSGANASPFDQESGSESSSSASQKPGSITPSQNNAFIVTAATTEGGGSPSSVDEGMTLAENLAIVGGQHLSIGLAYKIQSTATLIDPAWTISGAANVSTTMAVFKSVAPSSGTTARWALILLGIG